MHLAHNVGKSVVVERFIRSLKNKTYKYMTSMSKNVYLDKLDDIVNKHSNAYHRTFKMKPVDVKTTTYINFSSEINDEDPKFKIGDIARISKHKNTFAKGYAPNWSEKVFVIERVKITVPWTYVTSDLKGEEFEFVGTFYQKEL